MKELEELRKEIDKIDKDMVELFERRMEKVESVSKYKKENNIEVLNKYREEKVIRKNKKHLKDKKWESYLEKFYIELMSISKDYQRRGFSDE